MWALDHIAVTAPSLAEGVAHVEAALGVRMPETIGQHALMGTHNRLLGLGPSDYLEVIAVDPAAPAPSRPRWFQLDRVSTPPRLTNWVLRVGKLDEALARLPAAGRALDLARGDFRWRMAVPDDGVLPYDDCFPALLQWIGGLKPSDRLAESGCRLTRLEIAHPAADKIAAHLRLRDVRIAFCTGPAALRATINTPNGARVLQ